MNTKNGIIIINKPLDWTSHDVVAKLRGILKIKRIGHGGTLDPMATGVLPIFIGRATRAAEFSENAEKEYIAEISFGITTDTQDITGTVLSTCNAAAAITAEELQEVIPQFLYEQKQIPPMYSAVKIGGKKLYELARKGIEVERPARDIYISEIELLELWHSERSEDFNLCADERLEEPWVASLPQEDSLSAVAYIHGNPYNINKFTLRVVCSKGTYIRTLCHDIGETLGCGAVMSRLERTRVGTFTLNKAFTLEEVQKAAINGDIGKIIMPIDTLFQNYPALNLDETNTRKCKNGALCHVGEIKTGKYRAYSPEGEFLAFGEVESNKFKTIKSFFIPSESGVKGNYE